MSAEGERGARGFDALVSELATAFEGRPTRGAVEGSTRDVAAAAGALEKTGRHRSLCPSAAVV